MGTANSLLIVSNERNEVLELRSKFLPLRDIDSIIGAKVDSAVEACKKYIPDTVIICVHEQTEKYFEICRAIRSNLLLKNTPIMFVMDEFNEEMTVSGFDAGINDYICKPFKDSEILMRVIWCLQKSEAARELEKKYDILAKLGVVDPETRIYTPEYASAVFTNEIASAQKYRTSVLLMAVSADNQYKDKVNDRLLADIINKSTRGSDVLGMSEQGKIYVIMPRTKINGVNTIFGRINTKAEGEFTTSAGVCELQPGMSFARLSSLVSDVLNQALNQGNSVVVADPSATLPEAEKQQEDWFDKVQPEGKNNKPDKNSKIFKLAFVKKLNNIISPVFEETQNRFKDKYSDNISITYTVDEENCKFTVKDSISSNQAVLQIINTGSPKVIVDISSLNAGVQSNNRTKIDMTDLTEQCMLDILDNVEAQVNIGLKDSG